MPFHNFSPKAAKKLFKSSSSTSLSSPLAPQSPSKVTKPEPTSRKPSLLGTALAENFGRVRARIESINREKYESDLELSRMEERAAVKARVEAAQRAALDDTLREEALEALRERETPGVVARLHEVLEPRIRKEVYEQLRTSLKPKVHAELRTELTDEVTDQVWEELKVDLRDDVEQELGIELRQELEQGIREQLREELYQDTIAEMKSEYRDMVIGQLRGELQAEAALQVNGLTNGFHDTALDPALRAESEASDIIHAPSEMAVAAKRRHSDTFQGEDADERKKKIRLVSSDQDHKAASVPPMSIFDMFPSTTFQTVNEFEAVDESLEEGEKGDIEDELTRRVNGAVEAEDSDRPLEEVDEVVIPEDVFADGGDELSQPELDGIDGSAHSARDAEVEKNPLDMLDNSQLEDPAVEVLEQAQQALVIDPDLDLPPITERHNEPGPQVLNILSSSPPPKQHSEERNLDQTAIDGNGSNPYYTRRIEDQGRVETEQISPGQQEDASPSDVDEDEESEGSFGDEWNRSDPNDPTAIPYYDRSDASAQEDEEKDEHEEDEGDEVVDAAQDEQEDQASDGEYSTEEESRGPYGYALKYGTDLDGEAEEEEEEEDEEQDEDEYACAEDSDNAAGEDEQEYHSEIEEEEDDDDEDEEEEDDAPGEEAEEPINTQSKYSQFGGEDAPIDLDSD